MYSVESHAGRLVELRYASPLTEDEILASIHKIRMTVLASASPVIFAVDITRLGVLPPALADLFMEPLTRNNQRLERSGYLVSRRLSGMGMQIQRMLREAKNPARRAFEDTAEMSAYLCEVLDAKERARLEAFFAAVAAAG